MINYFSVIVTNAEFIRLTSLGLINPHNGGDKSPDIIRISICGISDSLAFSGFASRPAGPRAGGIELGRLIEDVVARKKLENHGFIEWDQRLDPELRVDGDREQLALMFDLIVQNAIEATDRERKRVNSISIVAWGDLRNRPVIVIRDTGCGMSDEDIDRAIEPFFTKKPQHSGVGLTIANSIWNTSRGTLEIQSRRGEGTKIKLIQKRKEEEEKR